MNLEQICRQVVTLSREIGQWMKTERESFTQANVETKTFNNLVSYVDKESEKRFVNGLLSLIPDSNILGEEGVTKLSHLQKESDYLWIIDPLDGTTNYIHGIPAYCTSVALQHHGKIIMGVVYEPNRDECFYTWDGGDAFCNEAPIHVSETNELSKSLLATGFPYDDFGKMDNYLAILKHFMQNTRGVRRIGAAALDLCYVAAGRFDGFYEYALRPWDVAAGAYIIENAGGKCSDFSGEDGFIFGGQIIAGNTKLNDAILNQIRHNF